jgi:hypothetical protein
MPDCSAPDNPAAAFPALVPLQHPDLAYTAQYMMMASLYSPETEGIPEEQLYSLIEVAYSPVEDTVEMSSFAIPSA